MAAPGHLVDSNILLRIARRDGPDHAIVDAVLARLAEGGPPSRNSLTLRRSQWDKALPCPSERSSDFFPPRSPLPLSPSLNVFSALPLRSLRLCVEKAFPFGTRFAALVRCPC